MGYSASSYEVREFDRAHNFVRSQPDGVYDVSGKLQVVKAAKTILHALEHPPRIERVLTDEAGGLILTETITLERNIKTATVDGREAPDRTNTELLFNSITGQAK